MLLVRILLLGNSCYRNTEIQSVEMKELGAMLICANVLKLSWNRMYN